MPSVTPAMIREVDESSLVFFLICNFKDKFQKVPSVFML